MRTLLPAAALVFLSGCLPTPPQPAPAPPTPTSHSAAVIDDGTDRDKLDAAVGKWVRVEGLIRDDKQPQIAGIDVEMPTRAVPGATYRSVVRLHDEPAWAEGLLVRWIVRPEQVDNRMANRGAGTFYRLTDPKSGRTVEAQRLGNVQ